MTWENGNIIVGSGSDFSHVLVSWVDPNPLQDAYHVSFGAYYDSSISWSVMHDLGRCIM